MNFAKILLIFATFGIFKLLLAEYIPYRARNTADTTEDASRCRCEEEEHFDVSLRSGQFKSPGCEWKIIFVSIIIKVSILSGFSRKIKPV